MDIRGFVQLDTCIGKKPALVAILAAVALGASTSVATADVVAGTEDGWGNPPGGVMLSVTNDDGSGNHMLTVTWGNIDPIPADGGMWECSVNERSQTTRRVDHGTYVSNDPVVNVNFTVKLDPPTGGSVQHAVAEAPGERITLKIECRTFYPRSFPTTPPSAPFGWHFEYQLR